MNHFKHIFSTLRSFYFDTIFIRLSLPIAENKLSGRLRNGTPRIAVVKQDVNEDLYCCPPKSTAQEIVRSTLLRSGPVALFIKFNADFYLLETEPDSECNIWKEKWTENRWCPIEWFEAFKYKVPGRDYGQSDFAVNAEDVDWSKYDIVISSDVSVPARITQSYPSVAWCYYVREIKTSSYKKSSKKPIKGQDLFLNHGFRRTPGKMLFHEIEFPYHLHYYGCFNDLFAIPNHVGARSGVFLEHHTVKDLTERQIEQLRKFGPLDSTAIRVEIERDSPNDERVVTTMEPEVLNSLIKSKYFVKCGGRGTFGTAMIEAISAGCLAIGDPRIIANNFLLSSNTSATCFEDLIKRILFLEQNGRIYQKELIRQRRLINFLCYYRPTLELLIKSQKIISNKSKMK